MHWICCSVSYSSKVMEPKYVGIMGIAHRKDHAMNMSPCTVIYSPFKDHVSMLCRPELFRSLHCCHRVTVSQTGWNLVESFSIICSYKKFSLTIYINFSGLFTADQKLAGKESIYTRQNPTGTRRGYECPEERDYYPYWHPTEWKDIAVLTSDTSQCEYYKKHSFNVEPKGKYL